MADVDSQFPKPKRARSRKATNPPTTLDPVEIALLAGAAGKGGDGAAQRLLESHDQLARAQLQLARHELLRGRLRIGRDIGLALLALALVLSLGVWVISAASSRAIVVQAFSVPPELARRGLTGEVVAQRFLDQLLHVQRNADSVRAPASFADAWSGDLKVQIPSTGVSLGEADRMLRRWLGDETHIVGEVFADGDRLRLSARSTGQVPIDVAAPEAEFDGALRRAAEGVFGSHQPYLYAVYLQDLERGEEALAILQRLAASGPASERAWGYNAWANWLARTGDIEGSDPLYRAAMTMDPSLPPPPWNLALNALGLGRDGQAYSRIAGSSLPLYRRAESSDRFKPEAVQAILATIEGIQADLIADHAEAERAARRAQQRIDYNASLASAPFRIAIAQAALHRPLEARSTIVTHRLDPIQRRRLANPWSVGEFEAAARIRVLAEEHDWSGVLRAAEMLARWQEARGGLDGVRPLIFASPWIARAQAELGNIPTAVAVIRSTPTDCTLCLSVRGRIAALAGRAAESDRWYRAAVATAPMLPQAYHDWAEARLRRGDSAGALALADDGATRGPRWADPLKIAGDALVRLNRVEEAEQRYREAAERAPRWGALHLAWARALWRVGRQGEALEKLRAAAAMDLIPADRARLIRMVAIAHGRTA